MGKLGSSEKNPSGGDELKKVINEAGLGNNPHVVRAFSKAGKLLAEDGVGSDRGSGNSPFGQMTPDEARGKALELQEQALNTENRIEKKRLNEEAQKFWKMVTKEKVTT